MDAVIKQLVAVRDAADAAIKLALPAEHQIIWGAKVSHEFKAGVLWIEEQLGLGADKLMACMAFETGGTFSPSVRNAAGSSAIGLIQFMRATHDMLVERFPALKKLAPTHEDLAKMSATQQLSFVYYYFRGFGSDLEKWSLEDTYMAILFPAAIGKPASWVMPWKVGSIAYRQNAGLDLNHDESITKAEACAGVRRKFELGKQFVG